MPKPICVECKTFFRPKKNGITWQEMDKDVDGATWHPVAMWDADLWACAVCRSEIIVGHAKNCRKRVDDPAEFDRVAGFKEAILLSVEDF